MNNRLFLGNLDYEIKQRDLERFFEGYGRINELKIKRGYGFAEFDRLDDAKLVVRKLDGVKLVGRPISICYAREKRGLPRSRSPPSRNSRTPPPRVRRRQSRSPSFGKYNANEAQRRSRELSLDREFEKRKVERENRKKEYEEKHRHDRFDRFESHIKRSNFYHHDDRRDDVGCSRKRPRYDDDQKDKRASRRRGSSDKRTTEPPRQLDSRSTVSTMVARLRKKEALKNMDLEDGEIFSDDELSVPPPRKVAGASDVSSSDSDDDTSDTSSADSDSSCCSICQNALKLKESQLDIADQSHSNSDSGINSKSSSANVLTDPEELKAFASPPSSPALSIEC